MVRTKGQDISQKDLQYRVQPVSSLLKVALIPIAPTSGTLTCGGRNADATNY